jgi:hypothetical protein
MAMGKYAARAQQFAEEVARSIEDKKAREAADEKEVTNVLATSKSLRWI